MDRSDFQPHFAECEVHGSYQRNMQSADGAVRYLATCPICTRDAVAARVLGRAAVPPRFQGKSFADFTCESEAQRAALAIARAYAENFAEQRARGRCLVFCGRPGTGKTHLACAILNTIVGDGGFGLYATVMAAVRRIKDTWARGGDERERDALRAFVRPDLLVLDEVGVQFGSEAERLILFEIINGRYEQERPTVVISNLDVKGVEESIGYRALDRLREGGGRVVVFDWESRRRAA